VIPGCRGRQFEARRSSPPGAHCTSTPEGLPGLKLSLCGPSRLLSACTTDVHGSSCTARKVHVVLADLGHHNVVADELGEIGPTKPLTIKRSRALPPCQYKVFDPTCISTGRGRGCTVHIPPGRGNNPAGLSVYYPSHILLVVAADLFLDGLSRTSAGEPTRLFVTLKHTCPQPARRGVAVAGRRS